MTENNGQLEYQQHTINVIIKIPSEMNEDAERAVEVWSTANSQETIRDYLFERIEVSPTFIVDESIESIETVVKSDDEI